MAVVRKYGNGNHSLTYNLSLLSGKIFRLPPVRSLHELPRFAQNDRILSVIGLMGLVGGFAANQTHQRLNLLNVISNEVRNLSLNMFIGHK
jgi:hypothetical protein